MPFSFFLCFFNIDPSTSIQCGCICFGLLDRCVSRTFASFHFLFSFFSFYASFLLKVLWPTLNDHGRSKGWSLSLRDLPSYLVCPCCPSLHSFLQILMLNFCSRHCTHWSFIFPFSIKSLNILQESCSFYKFLIFYIRFIIRSAPPACGDCRTQMFDHWWGHLGKEELIGLFYFMLFIYFLWLIFLVPSSFILGKKMELATSNILSLLSRKQLQVHDREIR